MLDHWFLSGELSPKVRVFGSLDGSDADNRVSSALHTRHLQNGSAPSSPGFIPAILYSSNYVQWHKRVICSYRRNMFLIFARVAFLVFIHTQSKSNVTWHAQIRRLSPNYALTSLHSVSWLGIHYQTNLHIYHSMPLWVRHFRSDISPSAWHIYSCIVCHRCRTIHLFCPAQISYNSEHRHIWVYQISLHTFYPCHNLFDHMTLMCISLREIKR